MSLYFYNLIWKGKEKDEAHFPEEEVGQKSLFLSFFFCGEGKIGETWGTLQVEEKAARTDGQGWTGYNTDSSELPQGHWKQNHGQVSQELTWDVAMLFCRGWSMETYEGRMRRVERSAHRHETIIIVDLAPWREWTGTCLGAPSCSPGTSLSPRGLSPWNFFLFLDRRMTCV